ncbi:MAG TPA: hypothetical protein VFS09_11095 [Candidatus Eisenbacteria bacterium]|nr:hypothetical protein [Candidatus Eisenbacteria bacterium]
MNTITPAAVAPRGKDRRFYTVMAVLIALTVFAGFAPTFYLRALFEPKKELTGLVILHGILFTSWIALFVTQVRLVAAKRTDIHRKLGVAGGFLAAAMPVVGFLAAIASAKNGFTPPNGPPPLVFLIVPLTDVVLFPTLVGLALYFRRRTDIHRRLMLVGTLAILTPAIARIAFIRPYGIPAFLGITDLFILGALAYDRIRNGRFHPAFVWGALLVIVSQPARILFAQTAAWHSIATWLTR